MAKMTDAQWSDIDVGSLSHRQQMAYGEYKVAQREAARLREAFETSVRDAVELPAGMRMVFGYRFGKLSAAVVEDERKPAKAKQSVGSLADFLAMQNASGRRA